MIGHGHLDEATVALAAAELSQDGWLFTQRQLYYAVCARLEPSAVKTSASEIGCGLLLLAVGGFVAQVRHDWGFWTVAILGALVILSGLRSAAKERLRLPGRSLALSYEEFCAEVPWPYSGSVDNPDSNVTATPPVSGSARPLLVCDNPQTTAWVRANAPRLQLAIDAVDEGSMPSHPTSVIALHDCSPHGCGLPLRLAAVGVGTVVDAGLRPRQVLGAGLQEIDGPPVHLDPSLEASLEPDERDWLLAGRRVELAAVPRETVAESIRAAALA